MITVGLTGGIASGKTIVAEIFRRLGAYVIDSDTIAREVVTPQSDGWRAVVGEFGQQILTDGGEIDRVRLGDTIFSDPERRDRLNKILHPLIIKSIRERVAEIGARDAGALVIADVPLLLECCLQGDFDRIIVVWAPEETRLMRLMERNGLGEEDARKRIAAQMPLDEKRAHADYVIENDKSEAHTEKQVRTVFSHIRQAGEGTEQQPV